MAQIRIVSVNVGEPEVLLRGPAGDVISSINKRPAAARSLWLTELNLQGDRQADTRPAPAGGQVHGGPDQAVYAFPSEHFAKIQRMTGQPVWPGLMGENLTTQGPAEDDVCIGDIWQWGPALLQVTAPRGPCYKLGIRIGRQAMRAALRGDGLVGWYLRVLVPGRVPTRGSITAAGRHPGGLTVAAAHAARQDRLHAYPDLAGMDVMSASLRGQLMHRNRDLTGGVPEED